MNNENWNKPPILIAIAKLERIQKSAIKTQIENKLNASLKLLKSQLRKAGYDDVELE